MLTTLLALGAALAATPQPPAATDSTTATAVAVRVTHPPEIDGRGDDAAWQGAPKTSGFRQHQPRVDVDPTFRTEFQLA